MYRFSVLNNWLNFRCVAVSSTWAWPIFVTSNVCKIWVVWAGNSGISIFLALASCMTSIVMGDSWLSRSRSTGRAEPQWGMKVSLNHLKNRFHIARLREPIQPLTRNTNATCCMRKRFFKNNNGRKNCPMSTNAEMSSYIHGCKKTFLICRLTF